MFARSLFANPYTNTAGSPFRKRTICGIRRLALPRPRNTLLDDSTAKVDVHLTLFRARHGLQQNRVTDFLLSGKR